METAPGDILIALLEPIEVPGLDGGFVGCVELPPPSPLSMVTKFSIWLLQPAKNNIEITNKRDAFIALLSAKMREKLRTKRPLPQIETMSEANFLSVEISCAPGQNRTGTSV